MGAPVLCERFVGRTKELELMLERVRLASRGDGSLVVLGGDAGIGKSRFLRELARRFVAEHGNAAIGECLEYARSPLGPFVDVLERIARVDPDAFAAGGALTRALAPSFGTPPDDLTRRERQTTDKRQQFAAISRVLHEAAERRPWLVAIEDIHWADHATLELLQFLPSKIAGSRLLLVATYRTDELHRRHPVTPALARIVRSENVWHTKLEPFSAVEMNAFVSGALRGREPPDFAVIASIKVLAEGNPLFVEELLHNALDASRPKGGAGLTPSIRDVLLARLNLLAEAEQRVLVHGAVLGSDFEPELLAAVSGAPLDAVRGVLRRARDLQFVVEHTDEDVRYSFRHEITREALCEELLVEEARDLHARVTAELEVRRPDAVCELAYHSWASRDAPKAIQYSVAAADAATTICAFSDAVLWYERALGFLNEPSRERAAIHEKIADALFYAGSPKNAIRRFERSLADYETCGDLESAARICERIAYQCFLSSDGDACLAWCVRAAETIRAVPDSRRYQQVLAFVARLFGILSDLPRSLEYLEEAERRGDPQSAEAANLLYLARGNVSGMMGRVAQAIQELRYAVAALPVGGDADTMAVTLGNLGVTALELGLDEIAERAQEAALQVAREHLLPARELYVLGQRAEMRLRRGDFARALSAIQEALPLADVVDFPSAMYAKLTGATIRLGLRTEMRELFAYFDADRMLESSFGSRHDEFITEMVSALVEKLVDEGRFPEASALLHRGVTAVGDGLHRASLLVLVAAYGEDEDLPAARASLAAWAGPDNLIGHTHLAFFDAHLAMRGGDASTMRFKAVEAAALYARFERPYERARALELAGEVAEAQALYERIGDVRDATRLRTATASVNRRGRAKHELTPREIEISALVARGKSNRAVAEELVISERTVEKHLDSIFAKLGVTSRTELAVRLAVSPSR